MSDHDQAGVVSQRCCDSLQAALVDLGALSAVKPSKSWCVLNGGNGALAYVKHKKEDENVTVYLHHRLGEGDVLAAELRRVGLPHKRRPRVGKAVGWAAVTTVYLYVADAGTAEALSRAIVAYWGMPVRLRGPLLPEEVSSPAGLVEGATTGIAVNRYERSAEARAACIEHYGTMCQTCGIDLGSTYGVLGRGYIHVHHLVPLSTIGEGYVVDPIRDLLPVCPNCHAMLHREDPPIEPARFREMLRGAVAPGARHR